MSVHFLFQSRICYVLYKHHSNMTNWKYFTVFVALVVSLTPCFATNKRCVWVIDVVGKENLSKEASVILPEGNYFLRIRVKCDEMINSEMVRSLVLTGVNPLISIESEAFGLSHHKAKRYSMLMSASLIEMGNQESCGCLSRNKKNENSRSNNCFCNGGIKPSCSHSKTIEMVKAGIECCQIEKNCSTFSELCNPAWLAPLHVPEMVTTLHCEVIDSGIGPYIESYRYTVHLDGFHLLVNNTIHNRLGEVVTQLPSVSQQITIHCVPNLSPICIIGSLGMSNHIIYTASEFEKMQFVKIQLKDTVQNSCASKQSQSSVEVKGGLSLPDRILLNTNAGILEVQADHTDMPTNIKLLKDYTLVFAGCVSHVVIPAQSAVHTVTLLGFGEDQDQEKVFVALPQKGAASNFTEQRDSNGQNACQFLRALLNTGSYPCRVISGSVSGVKAQSFVILAMLKTPHGETFHLVQFEGTAHNGNWTALFHFPKSLDLLEKDNENWQRIESKFSADSSEVSTLFLTGLTFTPVVCDSLFIWGNFLFYSPDGGISIHWLTEFPGNSTIIVLTSSPFDAKFAFITDNQEVWVGQTGSAKLQRLQSSVGEMGLTPGLHDQNDSFIVTIFFDSAGRLQQILADGRGDGGETECISREEIPVGRIISRQVFAQKQKERIRNYQIAKTKSNSCLQKPTTNQNLLTSVERACPFARIIFEAKHDVLYTRQCFYKLEPSVHWDSGLIQNSATLHEYFTRVKKAIDPDCSGISQDRRQAMKDFLPDVIQLGRSEGYTFVFFLYLDYDFQVETSTHSWGLTHLQASLHVSDAAFLNITSQRTEVIPHKAVKYEVIVQDGGLRLPQYRPGEGLTPASIHIQIWNSVLSCSTVYGSTGSLQGSYVMTVLLGCPAGRKLVFDPEASKNASGKEHFCSPVHGVPCFYFYRDFLPVFKVLDLATGQVDQFHGKYGLKIVGGGPTYQSVTDYSQEEQTKYNYQTTSSMAALIWASKLKTLGDIPVFNSKTNGISWLCGTQSPCADIGPNFPGNAEYYFKLEFSNRIVDADSSNCDYTIRFLIRVHGLPPGSFNPSSVIVQSCIGILVALILIFFLLKRQDSKLWRQLKIVLAVLTNLCRERIYNASGVGMFGLRRNRVDPLAGQVQLETIHQLQAMNKDTEDSGDDASVDIRESTREQHRDLTTNV